MDEKNKLPEEQNIEEMKEQGTPAPESRIAHEPVSKTQIPKLPLIIGGIVAVAVIVGLIIAIALGGSKNNGDNSHNHTFEDWSVTKNATCTEDGVKTRYCNCGEKQTDVIPANGHAYINGECENCGNIKETSECKHNNFDILVSKDATCTETGLTEGKRCSDCGEILLAQQELPVTSHLAETIPAVEATCTENGLTAGKKCSVCGTVLVSQQETPLVSHTATEIIKGYDATCTSTGLTDGTKCTKCGKIVTQQTTIDSLGHIEVTDSAVPATCTTDGKSSGKHCGRCNYTLVAQTTIPASGHKYDDGVIISEATCLSQGIKQYTCTVTTCRHSYTENYSLPTYTATEINNQALNYVGEIITYDKNGAALSLGTGFVMSSDGTIITNYHVIEGAYSAEITINNTKYTISYVLAYDANIDLAILKVNGSGLTAATICKQSAIVGETVYAIGSSKGMTNTFSQGIVTFSNRIVDDVSHVQHDASITNGNSGGPLINVYGEVIGINTWGISDSQNLNFAVATSELDNLVYLGTPITIAQLYEQNCNAYETLLNWVLENYNDTGSNWIEYRYQVSGERYSIYTLTYFINTNTLCLQYYYVFSNDDTRYVSIELSEDNTSCRYYASYTDGDYSYKKNVTQGYIYPSSFTKYTSIGYYSFEGDYWTTSSLLNTYQEGMVYSLEWFEVFLDVFGFGFTLSDFGFTSF